MPDDRFTRSDAISCTVALLIYLGIAGCLGLIHYLGQYIPG